MTESPAAAGGRAAIAPGAWPTRISPTPGAPSSALSAGERLALLILAGAPDTALRAASRALLPQRRSVPSSDDYQAIIYRGLIRHAGGRFELTPAGMCMARTVLRETERAP